MGAMKEVGLAIETGGIFGQAAEYIYNGWKVMPLKSKSKDPHFDLIKRAYLDATDNWEVLKFWHKMDPNMNIGIACQPSGLVVFDVDFRNGGEVIPEFTETFTVKTGDGFHFYYQAPAETVFKGKLEDGIDIKWKGYVAAAPSIHPSGKVYEIVNSMKPAVIPADLLEMSSK
jgi:hypothetical protein